MGSRRFQHFQRSGNLAFQAVGLLVDNEDVRIEGLGRMLDNGGAHGERLLGIDMQAKRSIFPIAQLDDAGNTNKIDPCLEIKTADDGGAGENENRQVLVLLYKRVCHDHASTQMTEAKGVVAVDQDASRIFDLVHGSPPRLSSRIYGVMSYRSTLYPGSIGIALNLRR